MINSNKVDFKIIPDSKNVIYEQRESGITHSPFIFEYILYNAIKLGNEEEVTSAIENYLKNGLVIGRLSDNTLHQIQYWAVSCIATAIHYAILGGADETEAYNLSDIYIRHIDKQSSINEIIPYLKEKALELTNLVSDSKYKTVKSPIVRHCLHFINIHLHDKLEISELAKECGVSRDYLSTIFKKEVSNSLHAYILHEKLEASKILLSQNKTYDFISYSLSFCSETHYITCFKREYGITPGQYKRTQKF